MLHKNTINELGYDGLQTKLIVNNSTGKIILISLEKGAVLAKHVSDTDASITILEGEIDFEINAETHRMQKDDVFSFLKNEMHELTGIENAKILLCK